MIGFMERHIGESRSIASCRRNRRFIATLFTPLTTVDLAVVRTRSRTAAVLFAGLQTRGGEQFSCRAEQQS